MNAKEAIQVAKIGLLDMFESEDPQDIRLEEIEQDNMGRWVVTLSYFQKPSERENLGLMAIAAAINVSNRAYKLVIVNTEGDVESIKIRKNG